MTLPGDPPSGPMDDRAAALIANERAKLSATYANGLAISIFAVGGLAPVFNVIYGTTPVSVPTWAVLLSAGVCWIVSGVLHLDGSATSSGSAAMTTMDLFSLFAMPLAGLAMAGFLLWYTRRVH